MRVAAFVFREGSIASKMALPLDVFRMLLLLLGMIELTLSYNIYDYEEIDYNDYNLNYNDYGNEWELSRILNDQRPNLDKYPAVRNPTRDILHKEKRNV